VSSCPLESHRTKKGFWDKYTFIIFIISLSLLSSILQGFFLIFKKNKFASYLVFNIGGIGGLINLT